MRKYFRVALEDKAVEKNEIENVISLEEAAVLTDEANKTANDVEQDLSEAERITEVSDALEDLAVIADGIDEASPAEVALIENAGQMAVAGTDIAPEEIIPEMVTPVLDENGEEVKDPESGEVAVESYVGRKISTEGIRETAKNIWENILKYLKTVWEKITSFFNKIFDTIPRLKKSIEEMEVKVKAASSMKSTSDTVSINSGVESLSIEHKPADSEAKLKDGISELALYSDYVFGEYTDSVVFRGNFIAKAIDDFKMEESTAAVSKLHSELKEFKAKDMPKKGTVVKSRDDGFVTTMSAPLLGNVNLADKQYIEEKDVSDLAALDRYRNSRIELVTTRIGEEKNSFEMKTISVDGMESLLKETSKLLDIADHFKNGSKLKTIEATRKAIEEASSKAAKNANKENFDVNYRAILNFNTAYARWAQTPAMPMLKHVLSSVRAILFVVSKSLAVYKEEPASKEVIATA